MMMKNVMPMLPPESIPAVDVRDVALAHIKAMKLKEAAGKRSINAHTEPHGSTSGVLDISDPKLTSRANCIGCFGCIGCVGCAGFRHEEA